jgi:multimeric flavodoxin WrbA
MAKFLLISGSPRNGNTEFVLTEICNSIDSEKEIIFLREKNIQHCRGCLSCHQKPKCVLRDDMQEILEKMKRADVLVIGSPNYFDNVTGLLKDFIDRSHPYYKKKLIKGKKLALIFVGGGEVAGTQKFLKTAMAGFVKYLHLDLIGVFSFQALNAKDLEKNKKNEIQIKKIIKKLKRI